MITTLQARAVPQPLPSFVAQGIGRTAVRSLHAELSLYPKPGLVSPIDNGSHDDMSIATFMRSLFSLRHYFPSIAMAGARGDGFVPLKALGIQAETRMLDATGGINTHRGAIFNLGLLSAATGYLLARGAPVAANSICRSVSDLWGSDILSSQGETPSSNGSRALARHGGDGARQQAAEGYQILLSKALPCMRSCLRDGLSRDQAGLQTLFMLMTELNDTNVLHRAGQEGLEFVKNRAAWFLAEGGVRNPRATRIAVRIHQEFVHRRISPGGAADLLACVWFLHDVEALP